jgi:diguanylate cyclase (GGDEF)-like protein
LQEKNGNQIPTAFEALVPEIYMPRLQFFVRILLGALSALYFNFIPIRPLILSVTQINLIIVSYYAFHFFWWWYYQRYGSKISMLRLGSWIDIMGAFVAALCDPFIIPPTILLFLIAVLGNGIQHGLYIIVESMIGAFILGIAALVIHYSILGGWPPYHLYFYMLFIVVGVNYSYFLVRRIELMKKEAIRISEYDSLTETLNRRAFFRVAEYLLLLNERMRIPLVFIFIDLDNFKAVNDQFGHDMGDKVLKHFSDMVQSNFRQTDIIARYGGDEFVILLTNTSRNDAESAVQKLQVEYRDWAQNNGLPVRFSFGLAVAPEGRSNLGDILKQADAALYNAKMKGFENNKGPKTKDGVVGGASFNEDTKLRSVPAAHV